MSLHPVDTAYGKKMRIHQGSCNKDYSCALGDCPSFVTVKLKPGARATGSASSLADEAPPAARPTPTFEGVYRILSPGIGGTGVITVNALLATAAAMDGLSVTTLDQTGLAQKGGAVVSHLMLTHEPRELAAKINTGNADLVLGFDVLGAASPENLKCVNPARTAAVLNVDVTPTSEAIREGRSCDADALLEMFPRKITVNASAIAEELFGSHLFVNIRICS
jgi:indolepyruvate ferredoxin oxidoreductase